jgi:hypothetical protein
VLLLLLLQLRSLDAHDRRSVDHRTRARRDGAAAAIVLCVRRFGLDAAARVRLAEDELTWSLMGLRAVQQQHEHLAGVQLAVARFLSGSTCR